MSQNVIIKFIAETKELEQSLDNLIKQVQSKANKLKVTSPTTAYSGIKAASEEHKRLESQLVKEKAGLDLINKSLDIQKNKLEEILKREKEGENLLKERIKLEERLDATRRVAAIQRTNYEKIEAQTRRSMGLPTSGAGGSGTGGGFGAGGITSLGGLAGFLGVPGMILGGVGTAGATLSGIEAFRRGATEAPLRARQLEANAFNMQGGGGQRLQAFLQGGTASEEELAFNPLRLQAKDIAQSAIQRRYQLSGSPLEYGLGGAFLKKALGEKGLGALEHGEFGQTYRALMGKVGFEGYQKEFEQTINTQAGEKQAEQFQALKAGPQNAFVTQQTEKYLQDFRRNLDFQRQTGLNSQSFRGGYNPTTGQYEGGFLGGVQQAGFTGEQGMAMAGNILGAGGSTRAATGTSAFGLQAQRAFDLTNSGQVLGALSGQLGGSELTKEALIKIQAEGTRIGVNQSEFREENRKFVEMAANVINQSNVASTAGIDQLVSNFGKFMSERTTTGMQAGQSAYQAYQQQSNIQTGPSATMRAAGMLRNPVLRTLGTMQRAALFTMNSEEINPDDPRIKFMANSNPTIRDAAQKAGVSPEQYLVNQMQGIIRSSQTQFGGFDKAINKLQGIDKTLKGPLSPAALERTMSEREMVRGEAMTALSVEQVGAGLSPKGKEAYVEAMAKGDQTAAQKIIQEEGVKKQLEGPQTGRPEDITEKRMAETSRLVNQMFMSMKDSITPAADETRRFAEEVNKLVANMKGATTDQRAKVWDQFLNQGTAPTSPMNQTQSTPPSSR